MQAPHHGSLRTLSGVGPVASVAPTALVSPFPFMSLDVYRVARQLAALVCTASIADAELRDQATRAVKSAFLNLCEGLPDDRPAVRRRYFRQADGSVHEVAGALDLAAAIGALDGAVAQEAIALAGRFRALLRGLMR
jgi:four helix bundle protein